MNCMDCGRDVRSCICSWAGGKCQVPGMPDSRCHACGIPGGYEFCTRIECPNPYTERHGSPGPHSL